tara:strand:- start:190 stop:738 length:549 start_codon:yes stop_codon:yes gene_type:complete
MRSLTEIKHLRKKYHLNQKELAEKAGVSQSLIAKIEAGKVEPTFSKVQQIFQALEELREKEEVKAKSIMNKKVHLVGMNDSLNKIIILMKSKNISQVPVLNKEKVCGLITEGTILKATLKNPEKISSLNAENIMEDAPPIISMKTGIKTLSELLKDYPIILVAEKGDINGVISKSDLLGRIE